MSLYVEVCDLVGVCFMHPLKNFDRNQDRIKCMKLSQRGKHDLALHSKMFYGSICYKVT